jgi:Putative prokaryotic signal transducing protein
MTSTDPDRPIVLATFPTEILASLLAAQLRDEGILTEMSGALTAGFLAGAPGGVHVLVRTRDATRAGEILEQFRKQGGE